MILRDWKWDGFLSFCSALPSTNERKLRNLAGHCYGQQPVIWSYPALPWTLVNCEDRFPFYDEQYLLNFVLVVLILIAIVQILTCQFCFCLLLLVNIIEVIFSSTRAIKALVEEKIGRQYGAKWKYWKGSGLNLVYYIAKLYQYVGSQDFFFLFPFFKIIITIIYFLFLEEVVA